MSTVPDSHDVKHDNTEAETKKNINIILIDDEDTSSCFVCNSVKSLKTMYRNIFREFSILQHLEQNLHSDDLDKDFDIGIHDLH